VLDITSVKTMPVDVMHRYLPQALVLGAHPVFGPATTDISGQNVVLTPTSQQEHKIAAQLKDILENEHASVSLMSPEKHDELMAVVLGLAHYLALVAGDTLLSRGNFDELFKVSGPTFRSLLSFIESVVCEDPSLYAAIQMNLAALPSLQSIFIDKAKQWAELVKNEDATGFAAKMSSLSELMKKQLGK
jgi:prephenate dehydrogenase